MYEVEQKYPIQDRQQMLDRLLSLPATLGREVRQTDTYFAHPARDFRRSDEALRIRSVDDRNFVTYKGPKIDSTTKTRREIELSLPPDVEGRQQFTEILIALGFHEAITVRKTRQLLTIDWQGQPVEIALDCVDELGDFIELETKATAQRLDEARAAIASLAEHLCLANPERRSYADLIDRPDGE